MPDVISREEGEGRSEEVGEEGEWVGGEGEWVGGEEEWVGGEGEWVGENPIEEVEEGTGVQLLSCITKKSR